MPLIVLLLIALPLAEIAVLIQVGSQIGVARTILAILLTGLLGLLMMRHQGFRTLQEAQNAMRRNEPPVRALFDGFCIFIGGVCLLIPGFITDVVGILLLLPPLRRLLGRRLWNAMERSRSVHIYRSDRATDPRNPQEGDPSSAPGARKPVIDAEFQELDSDGRDGPEANRDGPGDEDGRGPPVTGSRWGDRRSG